MGKMCLRYKDQSLSAWLFGAEVRPEMEMVFEFICLQALSEDKHDRHRERYSYFIARDAFLFARYNGLADGVRIPCTSLSLELGLCVDRVSHIINTCRCQILNFFADQRIATHLLLVDFSKEDRALFIEEWATPSRFYNLGQRFNLSAHS